MSDELVDITLVALPVPLHQRTADHLNGLQRELELIRIGGSDSTGIPDRLRTIVDELTDDYGGVGDVPRAELDAAAERGEPSIDLVYRIPRSAGGAARRLSLLLDQVDDYCRSRGHLLTLVTPSDVLEYRRWFLGEFTRQSDGAAPVPWSERRLRTDGHADVAPLPSSGGRRALPDGWALGVDGPTSTLVVAGSLDLVSAPALRDLLVDATSTATVTVVDLTRCGFIDSVGVSVLAAALVRADEGGASLRFGLSDAVTRVLEISGLLDRIVLVDELP